MDKLKMHTPDLTADNIEKIGALFPNCVTETKDEHGKLKKAINFDMLRQMLSDEVVEGDEAYEFTWVGKKAAMVEAHKPIRKTLRPCKDESVDWENTQNIFVIGDNLEALKILQESYLGAFDLIYIDPPYNTGTNMIYSNDYSESEEDYIVKSGQASREYKLVSNPKTDGRHHSRWLSMMYSRLLLARTLLKETGFCVLAMDDSEIENLVKICDEVLGESNRIGIVTVVHKPEGRNQEKFFGTSNEFAVFYAKDKTIAKFQNVMLQPELAKKYNLSDNKGNYKLQNFIRLTDGKLALRKVRPKFWYPIFVNPNKNEITTVNKSSDADFIPVFPITKAGVEMSWKVLPSSAQEFINRGDLVIDVDRDGFISIMEKMRETQVIKTHWIRKEYNAIQYGTKIANDILGAKVFDFPKSLYLMEDIIKLTTDSNGLILDIFGGSGTTAHAVMDLNSKKDSNRNFVVFQLDEEVSKNSEATKRGYTSIDEITLERIKKVAIKVSEENKMSSLNSDNGVRVFRVDDTNMKDIYYAAGELTQEQLTMLTSNIKPDRTDLDLLFGCLLDWGLSLSMPYRSEDIDGYTVHIYNDGDLVACFDKNIPESVIEAIAAKKPLRVVFRDESFSNSPAKINVTEIFKIRSPKTTMKVI